MKIVGFAQLRNEESNGHLENWFKSMNSICDYIYIIDQASNDGSKEIYKREIKENGKLVVIYNSRNEFGKEQRSKARLLTKLLQEQPDANWIFWMDGDTILEKRLCNRENFEQICSRGDMVNAGGIKFGHLNLWRSDVHYRLDTRYHELDQVGVLALWRNNDKLYFDSIDGLHKTQYPAGLDQPILFMKDYKLIHRGFCTAFHIMNKYKNYKFMAEIEGAPTDGLERLLDEENLTVEVLAQDFFPLWFKFKDSANPTLKTKLKEVCDGW